MESPKNHKKGIFLLKNVFVATASAAFLFATSPASAQQVKRSLPACVSEDLLDEFVTYATQGDSNGVRQLLLTGRFTMLSVTVH